MLFVHGKTKMSDRGGKTTGFLVNTGNTRMRVNDRRAETEETREIRKHEDTKKLKKIFKTAEKPLEMKSGFMYNLPVVCLGMKW